jgi:hypothetical protein
MRPCFQIHGGDVPAHIERQYMTEDPRDFVSLDVGWNQHIASHKTQRVRPDDVSIEQDHVRAKVDEIEVVRRKLATSASGNLNRAAVIVAEAGAHRMAKDDYSEFERRTARATSLATLDERLENLQSRYQARVVSEPRVYAEDSPHSYYRDVAASFEGDDVRKFEAGRNMARYAVEVGHEARHGSPEGQRALRMVRESCRHADEAHNKKTVERSQHELRALGTGGGMSLSAAGAGAAAYIPPFFLIGKWAPFKGVHRSFADWCDTATLPQFGLQAYISAFTSATSVTQRTDLASVSESDPTSTLRGSVLVEISGQVTVSNALYDRAYKAGSIGGGFDIALNGQLQQQVDERVDIYCVNQAIAGGTAVAGAATYTNTGTLYADQAKGREVLTDTAGTRLRPTTFFSGSDLYSYVTRQVDSSGRPVISPQFAPGLPIQEAGDSPEKWSRFTGTVLPGAVLWIEDDNIPATGGNNQMLLSAPDQALVLAEGDPIMSAYPQTDAVNLGTIR